MAAEPGLPLNSHVFGKCQKAFNHYKKLKCTVDVRILSINSNPYIPEHRNFKLLFWFYFRHNAMEKEKIVTSRFKHYAPSRQKYAFKHHKNIAHISERLLTLLEILNTPHEAFSAILTENK